MTRGSIKVKGRWDYPPNSKKGKYDKKYYYWFAECTDEKTGEVITLGISYKKLSKVLEDIIKHEIKYYQTTLGITEARKRYRQLSEAMLKPIKEEEIRLDERSKREERRNE